MHSFNWNNKLIWVMSGPNHHRQDKLFLVGRENLHFSWKLCSYFNDGHWSGLIKFPTRLAAQVLGAAGNPRVVLTQSRTAGNEALLQPLHRNSSSAIAFPTCSYWFIARLTSRGLLTFDIPLSFWASPKFTLKGARGTYRPRGQGSSAAKGVTRCWVPFTGARVTASLRRVPETQGTADAAVSASWNHRMV